MTATTHDLRRKRWGHSIEFLRRQGDGSWDAVLFVGASVKDGDYVLTCGKFDGQRADLRYRVVGEVRRPMDPGDQHFATLVFDPEVNA